MLLRDQVEVGMDGGRVVTIHWMGEEWPPPVLRGQTAYVVGNGNDSTTLSADAFIPSLSALPGPSVWPLPPEPVRLRIPIVFLLGPATSYSSGGSRGGVCHRR